MPRARLARVLPPLAVACITIYGALLRFDALVQKYGTLDQPRWAAFLTHTLAPVGRQLAPYDEGWSAIEEPYVGGDPINYLRFARDMEHFYQPHVREPVFLALTKACLWLAGNQDIGLSFASLAGSLAAIVGTYLLASALVPRAVAMVPALLVATEFDMVSWSVDGWRDDTFTATVLFSAWGFLRVRETPSFGNALVLGLCSGLACLTRITALTFVVPGFAMLALTSPTPRRPRLAAVAVSLALAAAIVAPYLISCAIATGDPLYAINYHTVYYRQGEGEAADRPMSAADYIGRKFGERPMASLDTGVLGLFVQPFTTKWAGLPGSLKDLRVPVMWAAATGLVLMAFAPAGRLLLALLFSSLVPYAWTWNIAGGNAWRFTMHAYPIYIVAACYAATQVWRAGRMVWSRRMPTPSPRALAWTGVVLISTAGVVLVYFFMPWLVIRESIRLGEDVNIEVGPRDRMFYRAGWSPPRDESVFVRVSTVERPRVQIPLPSRIPYEIALRLDPVAPEVQQELAVLFNGQFVARFDLTLDPARVGSYRFRVQPHQVRPGRNELTLVPDNLVPAGAAGPRFAWLEADRPIGLRLWYVRILPNPD